MSWDKEELIGLGILLIAIIGLSVCDKLNPSAVEGIKWVGSSFLMSKGLSNLLPKV
jgi:hypothetical protein